MPGVWGREEEREQGEGRKEVADQLLLSSAFWDEMGWGVFFGFGWEVGGRWCRAWIRIRGETRGETEIGLGGFGFGGWEEGRSWVWMVVLGSGSWMKPRFVNVNVHGGTDSMI